MARQWDKHSIQAVLKREYGTLAKFAEGQGIKRPTLYAAFIMPVPSANRAMARALGVNIADLWPDWFHRDGSVKAGAYPNRTSKLKKRQKAAA